MKKAEQRIPKYIQLYEALKERLETEWAPGQGLPPDPEMCRQYGVSDITVRAAMRRLVDEGRVRREQGRGTFATKAPAQTPVKPHIGRRIGLCTLTTHIRAERGLLLKGMLDTIDPWQEAVEVFPFNDGIDQHDFVMNIVNNGWCDGLLIHTLRGFNLATLSDLQKINFPFVFTEILHPGLEAFSCDLSVETRLTALEGAFEAIGRNYSAATFVYWDKLGQNDPTFPDRAELVWNNMGVTLASQSLRIPIGPAAIPALNQAIEAFPAPHAIVIAHPVLADTVEFAIQQSRIKTTGELGVLQIGIAPETSFYRNYFTAVASPNEEIGKKGMRLLLDKLNGLVETKHIRMEDEWFHHDTLMVK